MKVLNQDEIDQIHHSFSTLERECARILISDVSEKTKEHIGKQLHILQDTHGLLILFQGQEENFDWNKINLLMDGATANIEKVKSEYGEMNYSISQIHEMPHVVN